jgi:surfeit locus 1 family protein
MSNPGKVTQPMITFRPNWKISLFTFALLPVLISFGWWQLDREQEKIQMQSAHNEQLSAPEVSLDMLDTAVDLLPYLKVDATGYYDNEQFFLLDNRISNGVVGYEVITPFRTQGGNTVLVNRGWIAQGSGRDVLPIPDPVTGLTSMRGSIYVPSGSPFLLSAQQEVSPQEWPQVIQSLDMNLIALALAEESVFPYTVRLASGARGALRLDWPLMNMMPEKHRAYAVQWFIMAAVLLMLFIYSSIRHPEETQKTNLERLNQ